MVDDLVNLPHGPHYLVDGLDRPPNGPHYLVNGLIRLYLALNKVDGLIRSPPRSGLAQISGGWVTQASTWPSLSGRWANENSTCMIWWMGYN